MDRTALVLAGTLALSLTVGHFRPILPTERSPWEAYWLNKLWLPAAFDVVVAGDSRVMEGVDPSEVSKLLGGARIANFGFDHAGWSPAYLAAVESKLDPAARCPTIVLAPTTLSLTENARESHSGFSRWNRLGTHEALAQWWLADLAFLFRPLQTKDLRRVWRGQPLAGSRILRPDGWAETVPRQHNPRQSEATCARLLADNPVAAKSGEDLRAAIRRWRSRGIRVVAFFPPGPAWLRKQEAATTGFDIRSESFVDSLSETGATWVELTDSYPTYDGAHYQADVARRLSQDLAELVAEVPCS